MSDEIRASVQESYAIAIARMPEAERDIYHGLPETIKRLCFACYEDGYMDGGKHGAQMAHDSVRDVAAVALADVADLNAKIAVLEHRLLAKQHQLAKYKEGRQ